MKMFERDTISNFQIDDKCRKTQKTIRLPQEAHIYRKHVALCGGKDTGNSLCYLFLPHQSTRDQICDMFFHNTMRIYFDRMTEARPSHRKRNGNWIGNSNDITQPETMFSQLAIDNYTLISD